jgi:hypothetical protein
MIRPMFGERGDPGKRGLVFLVLWVVVFWVLRGCRFRVRGGLSGSGAHITSSVGLYSQEPGGCSRVGSAGECGSGRKQLRVWAPAQSRPGMVGAGGTAALRKERDGPLRGAMPGMKLGRAGACAWVCGGPGERRRGGRCILGLACRPSSPVRFGPFEAAEKFGAGVPVAGHARCC